ncbi:hypothetical protein [Oceaniglobus ichthyenteri]|uniref:hypothetical protein n=1 Tax=Oceaniglobus ichthyenteri TaxID=2136177 RepID=UPI000D35DBDB|nr:hypothetical protein [Oceaniglobus ichthyenteri]
MKPEPKNNPLLSGLAMLGFGLLLRRWQPAVLTMPNRSRPNGRDTGLTRAVRHTRNGVATVLPGNLTGSIGRSLILAGAGLIAIRALDLLVEDDDSLF